MNVHIVLCDQVVPQDNGKFLYSGVYSGVIVAESFPIKLDQLIIGSFFSFEAGEKIPRKITLRVQKKNINDYPFLLDFENLPEQKFKECLQIPLNVRMLQVVFSDDTPLYVSYSLDDGEFIKIKRLDTLSNEQVKERMEKYKDIKISLRPENEEMVREDILPVG